MDLLITGSFDSEDRLVQEVFMGTLASHGGKL